MLKTDAIQDFEGERGAQFTKTLADKQAWARKHLQK